MRRRYYVLLLLVGALVTLRLWPAAPLSAAAPSSRLVLADDGSLLRMTLAADEQYRLWQDLESISPAMVKAILLKEDRYFYYHPGVNPIALARASLATYLGGDRQGASTLSMQLARRLYDINSRRIPGKLQQIAAAFWLELRYSKHDLLEAYLNLAPMGGNIEGVAAASQIYFHKSAAHLSLNEALSLAVMPQSPSTRAHFANDFTAARQRLADLWLQQYPDDPRNQLLSTLNVTAYRTRDLPFKAPHFSRELLKNSEDTVIHSTLNPQLQQLLQRQIDQFIASRQGSGVHNAAALLIDTREQAIKAWVGSADFFNAKIEGQVDAITARRSPGSTLKPFVYGLAFDQGLVHPLSILKDAPAAFGGFEPENFDRQFKGPISVHDALINSRNVPAVSLAADIHNPNLYEFLRQASIQGLRGESYYGLALALGGAEVSMLELARLYAMLANHGHYYPLRAEQQQPLRPQSPSLLSAAASFMVLDILKDNPRADGLAARGWPVAWKTGTSWGFRDAWSVGIVGPYVLVVWVGNFDARPNPEFVGLRTAGPLFFAINDALQTHHPATAKAIFTPPDSVKKVNICAESGDLPNPWCPKTVAGWFIPGVSPIKVSTLHRPVWVDNQTGQAVCPPYNEATQHQEVYAFWPSDMAALFRQAGLPRKTPPPLPEQCRERVNLQAIRPQIQSPLKQVRYSLRHSHPDEKVALTADAASDAEVLYWFADRRFLGQVAPGQTLEWRPEKSGRYHLSVTDDKGRSRSRWLTVSIQAD